jgi:hypothetical protein
MIFEVLQVIKEEVNGYFEGNPVSLDNIATIDSDTGDGNNGASDIILSLLNMQEEVTLKNVPNSYINGTKVTYKNPKIYLNLYILFSANSNTYEESLKSISKIIEFFQAKKVFTQDNTSYDRDLEGMEKLKNFKFNVDFFTPSFEELNYIWGTLGGKQYPSLIYKVSVLEIERNVTAKEGPVIIEVNNILKRN